MGRVIGIDLGTTNSCVSMVDQGKPIVIPNTGIYRKSPTRSAISASVDSDSGLMSVMPVSKWIP